MSDNTRTIQSLKESIKRFAEKRDWEPFHTPNHLAMALSIEASELMEHFLWLNSTEAFEIMQHAEKREAVGDELADVLIYALRFASVCQLDVSEIIDRKMKKNAERFPEKL